MGKRILLLGAGGHAMVVVEIIKAISDKNNLPMYNQIDFLDDTSKQAVGKLSELEKIAPLYDEVFCAIGNNDIRKKLLQKVSKLGLCMPVLIHPTAYISPTAVIRAGTCIEPKAIVNTKAIVEEGRIISVGAIVDHDAKIEMCSHVNAGSICKAGSVIKAERKLEAGEVVVGY